MRKWFAVAFLALAATPMKAHAWGEEGHKIVCGIAWQRMTPEARAYAAKLLGKDDEKTFAEACVWADQIRPTRPETSAWHYINIPAGQTGVDLPRDCGDAAKRCAPWAIVEMTRVLQNPQSNEDTRRDAMRFVMHFVGDLHQPLHAGRPEDLGGNRVNVDFFGDTGNGSRQNNLHSVWDSQILRRAGQKYPDAVQVLNAQILPWEAELWGNRDVVQWTNEVYRVCEDFVYGKLPQDHKLGNMYYQPALGYADVQLEKAGVRLAYLLNAVASGRVLYGA